MPQSALQSAVGWVTGASVFQAINEVTGATLWDRIGITRIEIPSEAESTEHPISNIQYKDGNTYLDLIETDIQSLKIIRPGRMRITALCGDLSTLESVIACQKNANLTIGITTKSVIVESLIITDVDVAQTPDKLSATQVIISLEQGLPPASTQYNPAQPGDQSANGFRVQQPDTATQTVSGLFTKVASKITNVVKPIAGALLGNKGEPFVLDTSKLG